ncbi:hypothetical protein BD324DRAFT_653815 [Kockovaella imperatae]|uniref:Uncharacterized protein n=1 Tax=Kockovaella imperatae TaxID=4999 RepID=A0A1Y1U6U2_9TREE|nr:hypothetical protein BD324DRAFT_653815 [Kockovaella imperatae]ORX33763.1 hypothetical protein BD324DRAFT_653815 [Kockovaella imperatae]
MSQRENINLVEAEARKQLTDLSTGVFESLCQRLETCAEQSDGHKASAQNLCDSFKAWMTYPAARAVTFYYDQYTGPLDDSCDFQIRVTPSEDFHGSESRLVSLEVWKNTDDADNTEGRTLFNMPILATNDWQGGWQFKVDGRKVGWITSKVSSSAGA